LVDRPQHKAANVRAALAKMGRGTDPLVLVLDQRAIGPDGRRVAAPAEEGQPLIDLMCSKCGGRLTEGILTRTPDADPAGNRQERFSCHFCRPPKDPGKGEA
jgi:hypothetical protein